MTAHGALRPAALTLSAPPAPTAAEIMCGLGGDRLEGWIAGVEADQLPDLHSFTAGLKRDLDAVVNGLNLPYSSGAVEGAVNHTVQSSIRDSLAWMAGDTVHIEVSTS